MSENNNSIKIKKP